jgi:hypothetical protein
MSKTKFMKINTYKIAISFIIFQLFIYGQVSAQSFSLGFHTYMTPAENFTHNEVSSFARVYSAPITDFAFNLELSKRISKNFNMDAGVMVGAYPIDYIISHDTTFSLSKFVNDDYSIYRTPSVYNGISIGLSYLINLTKKHSASIQFSTDVIYFFRAFHSYSLSYLSENGQVYRVFEAKGYTNLHRRFILAPALSFRYYYRIGKKHALFAAIDGTYSNKFPIVGSYTLFGKSENLVGDFKRRYAHAGLEVGVKFDIDKEN